MFKPMLAPQRDPLEYPEFFEDIYKKHFKKGGCLLASVKYDGIRGVVKGHVVKSRSFKPLPSYQVQVEFSKYEDVDGEFIAGSPTGPDTYNRTQSKVMSADKPGDITYNIFDYTAPGWLNKPFIERLEEAKRRVWGWDDPKLIFVEHKLVESLEQLYEFEDEALENEWEGIMLRDPFGHYKMGRATWNEGLIYKLKRFTDAEGLVVGIEEAMENTNAMKLDDLGYFKRGKSMEGLVPKGMLGKFLVDYEGQIIKVAPGVFDHAARKWIWEHREQIILSKPFLKFRHFAHGAKDAPRQARALGFRDPMDM